MALNRGLVAAAIVISGFTFLWLVATGIVYDVYVNDLTEDARGDYGTVIRICYYTGNVTLSPATLVGIGDV